MKLTDLVNEIRTDIKEIKSDIHEIKLLDAHQNASLDAHMARTSANEKRLEKLENLKWFITGLAAIITALGSLALVYFKSL